MLKPIINYNHIPVQKSTFKAGLAAKVHRWFRLTPSYGPDLVREMLSHLHADKSEVILDPFSGASTTLIESAFEGFDSYGFEINPLLSWVGKTSTNWNLSIESLIEDLNKILDTFQSDSAKIDFSKLEENGLKIPKIFNPLRWWREDVLTHLLILKRAINEQSSNASNKEFFLLGFAGVLVPDLTNVTLGRLQLHFINRDDDEINVISIFTNHINIMLNDLVDIKDLPNIGSAKIFNTNSVTLEGVQLDKPLSCVITSPPYPNRYSYVWNTRPHLYMLDFFTTPKEASDLDKETIGGTWGTATSILTKGIVEAEFPFYQGNIEKTVAKIRLEDNLMANYVMKYFNLLGAQIHAMESLPQRNLRCAYVVGNSRVKGIYVETDVLLGEIFNGLGYNINSIERIRKRNSGKDLHESIVYAEKIYI